MAGIGFHLQKLLNKNTYLASIQGYFHSAMVSSGPWILTVTSLLILNSWSGLFLTRGEQDLFQSTITYIFAFSLVSTGLIQMGATRYVADQLYLQKNYAILPSFTALAIIVGVVQVCLALIFWLPAPFSLVYKIAAIHLYVIVSLLWLLMTYLSAAKDYASITKAFLLGSFCALALGALGAKHYGVEGILAGFALGECLVLVLLLYRVLLEFPDEDKFNWNVLQIFPRYPILALIGVIYNLGIWVDKFVFWRGPQSIQVEYLLYYNPLYDNASFLAFLSVIPSLALLVIKVETDFYEKYKAFYGSIIHHKSMGTIQKHKAELVYSVRFSLTKLFQMQTIISLSIIIFAPDILVFMGMKWLQLSLVRYLALGALLHVMFLIVVIFLLYFDLRLEVFFLVSFFALTNLVATYFTSTLDPRFYGMGYLMASLISLTISLWVLIESLEKLEYIVFVRQNLRKVVVR